MPEPADARVVLGVAAGIAAYKAVELLRRLTEADLTVRVVPTAAALRFVGAPTWSALSGQPVTADVWTGVEDVPHVALGRDADLVVVAPATADLLARAATGRADDLLTAVLLTARCPMLFVPAMHTEMWEHPATRANVATLRARGVVVLDPATGRLTGADSGPGRLPEPAAIVGSCHSLLDRGAAPADLTGRRVLVTAGGTREHLDPVRFLGNASSGKQGYALAAAAAVRGAEVTVLSAHVDLPDPAGTTVARVGSTQELYDATVAAAVSADIVVMAAAPVDFRPATYSTVKIKKSGGCPEPLALTETPDIAAAVGGRKRADQQLVVFAAETEDLLTRAAAKLAAKRADLVVANDVSEGAVFGADRTSATILDQAGVRRRLETVNKHTLANAVFDALAAANR